MRSMALSPFRVRVKRPLALVVVPLPLRVSRMVAPMRVSPLALSVTVPLTVCWAKEANGAISKINRRMCLGIRIKVAKGFC